MTAAEAPGWPSICVYAARIARRLNQNVAASRAIGSARMSAVSQLSHRYTGTKTTTKVARKMPPTSRGSSL